MSQKVKLAYLVSHPIQYQAPLLRRIAQVLQALGVDKALVVHGSGLDEVALHAETRAIRIAGGDLVELVLTPEDAGFERMPLKGWYRMPKRAVGALVRVIDTSGNATEQRAG